MDHMSKSVVVNVVKESLDVHRKEGCRKGPVKHMFNVMGQGKSCVDARRPSHTTKLFWGDEIIS